MQQITYIICGLTSLASAVLLARAAAGPSRRLLFWGSVFFVGMALNNLLAFVDTAVVTNVDWSIVPNGVALASLAILIYALIWEAT